MEDVIRRVQALARGRSFYCAPASLLTKDGGGRGVEAGDPRTTLTARELQILRLLAEGTNNKQVAAALELSVRTVEAHRASLMRKLDLHSLSDLIYFAIRQQIVRI